MPLPFAIDPSADSKQAENTECPFRISRSMRHDQQSTVIDQGIQWMRDHQVPLTCHFIRQHLGVGTVRAKSLEKIYAA